jgi:glycosyltransferase involved in cell wall biosynthesis
MRKVAARLAKAGIGWSFIGDFPESELMQVPGIWDPFNVYLADRVRFALEELHDRYHFSLAEFGEWGGLGFRSIQARKAGIAFTDLPMAVKLHSSSQWMREGNHQWLAHSDEMSTDFCERYSFENADFQTSPCRYMFDYVRSIGWHVRADAFVLPYPYPVCEFAPSKEQSGCNEVVFFGRLETRKGLELFIRAARELPSDVNITFMGRVNVLGFGVPARDYIAKAMKRRPYRIISNYDREQALRYLATGNRLAVMPSLMDNAPFAVIECATNGIPFVASRVGAVPELVADPEVQERFLFDTTPRDLLRCLKSYLASDPASNAALRERLRRATDVAAHNEEVSTHYDRMINELPCCVPGETARPLVTVAIAYYNLGEYLPEALASLEKQTYRNLEVLVINDGSTDPDSVDVFEAQQGLYPQFRFLDQPNAGIGATRNRALAEAQGEFFLPMDADNVARPDMIERLVTALERNPDLSAVSCYYLAFKETEDIATGDHAYAYRPLGGPHLLASVRNVYGDANALFRTADFRAVGGFETDRNSSWEDLEAFVKLVNAGRKIDVLPDYLFYYRHLESGFSRVTDGYLNQQRVLRQFIGHERLPTSDNIALWNALVSLEKQNEFLRLVLSSLRYRVADNVHALFAWSPPIKKSVRWLLKSGGQALRLLRSRAG